MKKLLHSDWRLRQPGAGENSDHYAFSIPGDVHSALLGNGVIDDPYFRDNEYTVDWVHQSDWEIEREFDVHSTDLASQCLLRLDQVDCFASIFINNKLVGSTSSQFIHYCFDIGHTLLEGLNSIRIRFRSTSQVARQKAAEFPFELPFLSWNCRVPNTNMVRKTPCHAGWDWNICLMPIGVYGELSLDFVQTHTIEDIKFEQTFDGDDVALNVSATVIVYKATDVQCSLDVAGVTMTTRESLAAGTHQLHWLLDIEAPDKWWPVGSGPQARYQFTLTVGAEKMQCQIGFRKIRIVQTPDESGAGFQISVNGRAVFMRGANWIPADALPQRGTPDVVKELLQSALDANMNMLRVWGGGQYEPDWFYELCDEMGILIWQDFMFSCNHYPAADPDWLALVRTEAEQQVRRLSRHPCLALWCGDNELVGALKWWDVTRNNRDRYLANYSRLNHTLEMTAQGELRDTHFWPSSPSVGRMDFGDGWKNDAAGDMHFWDVWHEAKPFSAYQDIRSEFGFQSFPSMPLIETFTVESDRNVSSPVMDVHQRNVGGNARIVETLVRYFEFPDSFERMVFLSQCQQAMAIKTAVEYWRCLKPHCMGTLFWQLNDTWPVASWASLEYGGAWKLLQYAAVKFYQPLLVAMVPGHERFGNHGQLLLKAVNDHPLDIDLEVELSLHHENGDTVRQSSFKKRLSADAAEQLMTLPAVDVDGAAYFRWTWQCSLADSEVAGLNAAELAAFAAQGSNEYWLGPYKNFALPSPTIESTMSIVDGRECIALTCDKPAYFVSVDLGGNRIFSDNGFTLLPGEEKLLTIDRVLSNKRIPTRNDLVVQHL